MTSTCSLLDYERKQTSLVDQRQHNNLANFCLLCLNKSRRQIPFPNCNQCVPADLNDDEDNADTEKTSAEEELKSTSSSSHRLLTSSFNHNRQLFDMRKSM